VGGGIGEGGGAALPHIQIISDLFPKRNELGPLASTSLPLTTLSVGIMLGFVPAFFY